MAYFSCIALFAYRYTYVDIIICIVNKRRKVQIVIKKTVLTLTKFKFPIKSFIIF